MHRGARIAPNKVRLVAEVIRARPVPVAVSTLGGLKKRAAALLLKVLKTAVANAQDQADLDPEDLRVLSVRVDEGQAMKRARFRAFGRVGRYKHRTSHITVVIESTTQE